MSAPDAATGPGPGGPGAQEPAELLAELRGLGVELTVTDGRLTFRAPTGVLTDPLRQRLRTHRDALLALLTGGQSVRRALTDRQLRIWLLHQRYGGSVGYQLGGAFRLHGPLRTDLFRDAVRAAVSQHAALRTVVAIEQGLPVLVVRERMPLDVALLDVPGGTDDLVHQLVAEVISQPMDLVDGPLVRVALLRSGAGQHVVALAIHHLVADDHAVRLFGEQVMTNYRALAVEAVPVDLLVARERSDAAEPPAVDWRADPALLERVARRRAALSGVPAPVLPAPGPAVSAASPWAARSLAVRLDGEAQQAWDRGRRAAGRTSLAVRLAVIGLAVAAAGGPDELLVGTPGFGRENAAQWRTIGYFATTAVVRVALAGCRTFGDLLAQVADDLNEAWSLQRVPYEELVGNRSHAVSGGHVLWLVAYLDAPFPEVPGLDVQPVSIQAQQARHDLRIGIAQRPDGTDLGITYRQAAVSDGFVTDFAAALRNFSARLPAPDALLAELTTPPPKGREQGMLGVADGSAARLLRVAGRRRGGSRSGQETSS
ncbi:condensation domain-containing protein [Micromonospora sp. NPDC049051]|uniref:condensation domain-containing protein n=1 Tax=Micromonospora sp. NPDC049051 TaxID=3364264 RepID=UPI00371D5423